MKCFYFSLDYSFVFFFNDTATTEIYTLSLHDALPISRIWRIAIWLKGERARAICKHPMAPPCVWIATLTIDRKSTRLNSSHVRISYAVFCLKKKKTKNISCSVPLHRCSTDCYHASYCV